MKPKSVPILNHDSDFSSPDMLTVGSDGDLFTKKRKMRASVNKMLLMKNLMKMYNEVKDFVPQDSNEFSDCTPAYKAYKHYQKVLYVILKQPGSSNLGIFIFLVILFAILFDIGIAIFYDKRDKLSTREPIMIINFCILFIFMIELALRLFTSTAFNRKFREMIFKPAILLDMIVIAPLIIQVLQINMSYTNYNIVRLVKVSTLLKLLRYSQSIHIVKRGFYQSITSLSFLMFTMVISNVFFSILIYYAEAMNHKSEIRHGIPTAFWYCIVTMTTVGYGDVVPITPLGKVIGGFVSVYGTITIALPVVILGYHFQEIFNEMEEEGQITKRKIKELDGRDELNRDHKENFFLRRRIDDIEESHEHIMDSLKHSGILYKEVFGNLNSLFKSIYRGTKEPDQVSAKGIHKNIKILDQKRLKVSVTSLFRRGFGRLRRDSVKRDSIKQADASEDYESVTSTLAPHQMNKAVAPPSLFKKYIVDREDDEAKKTPRENVCSINIMEPSSPEDIVFEGVSTANFPMSIALNSGILSPTGFKSSERRLLERDSLTEKILHARARTETDKVIEENKHEEKSSRNHKSNYVGPPEIDSIGIVDPGGEGSESILEFDAIDVKSRPETFRSGYFSNENKTSNWISKKSLQLSELEPALSRTLAHRFDKSKS